MNKEVLIRFCKDPYTYMRVSVSFCLCVFVGMIICLCVYVYIFVCFCACVFGMKASPASQTFSGIFLLKAFTYRTRKSIKLTYPNPVSCIRQADKHPSPGRVSLTLRNIT